MRFGERVGVARVGLALGAVVLSSCAEESESIVTRSFVELGTGSAVARLEPAWLASDEATTIAEALTTAADADELDADRLDDALAALNQRSSDGTRGAAFVLPGCADTGAKLSIEGSVLSAELTGGENTNCDTAVYFLATFDIPDDEIPAGARLD